MSPPIRFPPLALLVVSLHLAGCGYSRTQWEFERALLDADVLADEQDYGGAFDAYAELAPHAVRDEFLRYIRFRMAYMLELQERWEEALDAYAELYRNPYSLYDDNAGAALFRTAGIVEEHDGGIDVARPIYRAVITAFPDSASADDALWRLIDDARAQGTVPALLAWIESVYPSVRSTEIADGLVYQSARLWHQDLGDPIAAMALYELVADRFHRSGVWDDAIWYTAQAFRELGRREEERRTLADFIAGREISVVMADYDSQWYGDAYFRLAEMAIEDGAVREAIDWYERWRSIFPLSLETDDVTYRVMELYASIGDRGGVRRSLRWLYRWEPNSRWVGPGEALLAELEAGR